MVQFFKAKPRSKHSPRRKTRGAKRVAINKEKAPSQNRLPQNQTQNQSQNQSIQSATLPSSDAQPSERSQASSNQVFKDVHVDTMDHHGQALVLSTRPITIVAGALANETVTMQMQSFGKNVQHAKVISIQQASEQRVKPFCDVYESCGGCQLQTLSAEHGLYYKEDSLKRFLYKMAGVSEQAWQAPILSTIDYSQQRQAMGYRRKVRLAIDARDKQNIKMGYRKAQSNQVVDIENCPVLHHDLQRVLTLLLPALRALPFVQKLGHLELTRSLDGVIVLINMAKSVLATDLLPLQALAERLQIRIMCRYKHKLITDYGEQSASLAISDYQDVKLNIAPEHFIQVNASVNTLMLTQVIEWFDDIQGALIHDFFCGMGNFTVALAKHHRAIVGYEVSESMVAQARSNAAINSAAHAQFKQANLSDKIALDALDIKSTDAVLLDPARDGAQALCEKLNHSQVGRIVYVSCNPDTLARDLKILKQSYTVKYIKALDMFPFTQHLETMALLERS
ncbi:23S rRNA (uracil(1939)-C(5))-methyltransferase RlmD [Glaciecola siphonariae]|uniref:23S rRNA (Uracil(1939)-C(5))-methyltransferase RlmD n=1 Tax=Glaciecola siphonariae TaxID=521012 RepID=A0ABV9M0K3_9ALTE